MRLAAVHLHPVKGCHRVEVAAVDVERWGLAGDRRWMIVDDAGVGVTQRETAALTGLRASVDPAGGLALAAPGLPPLSVPPPVDGPAVEVRTFTNRRGTVPARLADPSAAAWLSTLTGRPARLVWLHDPTKQTPYGSSRVGLGTVNFADAYPLLLTTTASLDALNDWLLEDGDEPVPITRFRANLVVAGARPWEEDGWVGRRLRIGPVVLSGAGLCDRCVVTTIDQETGEKGRQPLRMLGRHRNLDQGLIFGLHLLVERPGRITVGDEVAVD